MLSSNASELLDPDDVLLHEDTTSGVSVLKLVPLLANIGQVWQTSGRIASKEVVVGPNLAHLGLMRA